MNTFEFYLKQEYISEGANIDMTKSYSALRKEFKAEIKVLKSAIKSNDKKAAKESSKKLKSIVNKYEKEMKSVKADKLSSVILGNMAAGLMAMIMAIPSAVMLTGGIKMISDADAMMKLNKVAAGSLYAAGAASIIYSLIQDIRIGYVNMKTTMNVFIQSKKNKDSKYMNFYYNTLLGYVGFMKKTLNKIDKIIDKMDDNGSVKESYVVYCGDEIVELSEAEYNAIMSVREEY